MARLKDKYNDEIRQQLKDELGLQSMMQVPKLEKITLNMGVGDAKTNSKLLDAAMEQLGQIAGQKPVMTRAKKSVATFKLREGMPIGCKVTLRGDRMWEFMDRLIVTALPRIRDFRGIKATAFDRQGNFALGLNDQTIFPEIDYDTVDTTRGLDVIFTFKNGSKEGSKLFLEKYQFPFRKQGQQAQG